MSYGRMDHARWAEANGAATKRLGVKPRKDKEGQPMGWHAMPEDLSEFQACVMDILGLSLGGIYNAPIAWDAVRWGIGSSEWAGMSVPLSSAGLATWDFNRLTKLVLACHEARIRMDISPNGPRGLMLRFSRRSSEGGISDVHPNIDEAVIAFREYVGPDHRIAYRQSISAETEQVA